MAEETYLLLVILVMTAATFVTRIGPFVLFRNRADHPLIRYLGRYMPAAIMTILLLYNLRDIDLSTAPFGAPQLLAVAITAALHLWRGNALLSIFAGTGFYMLAVQGALFA
jgi:branched-subunit amino acid transport protein AzlD